MTVATETATQDLPPKPAPILYGTPERLDSLGTATAAALGGDWTYEGVNTDPRPHHRGRPVATLVDPYTGARVELRPVWAGSHIIATVFGVPATDEPPTQPERSQFKTAEDFQEALKTFTSKAVQEQLVAHALRLKPGKAFNASEAVHHLTETAAARALGNAIAARLLPALVGKQRLLPGPPSLHARHVAAQAAAAETGATDSEETAPAKPKAKSRRKPASA